MSARTARTRLLAAAALTAVTLTLTACSGAEGAHDEGAATVSQSAASDSSPTTTGGTSTGAGQAGAKNSASGTGSTGGTGSSGTTGSTSASGSTGSTGSTGSNDSQPTSGSDSGSASDSGSNSVFAPCTPASTRTTATVVSRPLNHLLLTVTNTGSKNCDLVDYPALRFGDAQSVPPAVEESKPQAVVTLAPGESGYASVLLSMADGSGSSGYTAKTLDVYFNVKSPSAAHPALPAKGVYVDSSISVSYWQSDMGDALAW
ncbi:DUF4232 domain-containing protein [Streptomyces sp. NBC_00280]|uniref:DUF4232 domain-containing protein n=1 Tax=Streptomyces sp. NBC_00280 TaxID=2975699 RepID=UPI0032457830